MHKKKGEPDTHRLLREHGIQPSAQRMAIAEYVLFTEDHPTADVVHAKVLETFPMISRATVYNTLNLFVRRGLLRQFELRGDGRIVFDPRTTRHHHFIDETSGRIHDIPWNAVRVSDIQRLPGFQVREYQVVMRGKVKRPSGG